MDHGDKQQKSCGGRRPSRTVWSQSEREKHSNDARPGFPGRPRAVFMQVGADQYYASMQFETFEDELGEQNPFDARSVSCGTSQHPRRQRPYVVYNATSFQENARPCSYDRYVDCRVTNSYDREFARSSSAELGRDARSFATSYYQESVRPCSYDRYVDYRATSSYGREYARSSSAELGRDARSSRSSSGIPVRRKSAADDIHSRRTSQQRRSSSSDEYLPSNSRRTSFSRERPSGYATPRVDSSQETAKQEVQVSSPKSCQDTVAVLLAALDAYHPGKLVEWLQRRTTRLEDAPVLPPAYDDDFYEAIGVQPNATAAEIRKAYRRLALLTHPDKPSGDRLRFDRIARAYTVLSDPLRRESYDAVRRNGPQPRPPRIVLRSSRDVASDVAKDLKVAGEVLSGACQQIWTSIQSQTQHGFSEATLAAKAFSQPTQPKQARMVSTAEMARRTPVAGRREDNQRRRVQANGAEFL